MRFYAYMFQIREPISHILLVGRLPQQFVIDMYVKIESNGLHFIRTHQEDIRADLYSRVMDLAAQAEHDASTIGRQVVLPSSFTGSPRGFQARYQDAMCMVKKKGRPDLFITVTCNPLWPEITELLIPGQNYASRPDIVCRVFRQKLKAIIRDIKYNEIFGPLAGQLRVIEFQKRGLPHAHILVILHEDWKVNNSDDINGVVSAEFPCIQFKKPYEALLAKCIDAYIGKMHDAWPLWFVECTFAMQERWNMYKILSETV
jgi:hypothetical protein